MIYSFPYGTGNKNIELDEKAIQGVLSSHIHQYTPTINGKRASETEIIEQAIQHPIGSEKLSTLAQGKTNVVLIISDHTRPVPSKLIVPLMLQEIRKENRNAHITILVATGCHRTTTDKEIAQLLGNEIVEKETIVIHDCDHSSFTMIGNLPNGSPCYLNSLVVDADLVVADGFIEPHFFAGYSGSRKSILPGVAKRETVLSNHCAEFIADQHARTGILTNNPIHKDMLWAAEKAHLAFIVNVIINEKKEVIYAVAGDREKAHLQGCAFLESLCRVPSQMADIVITSNGGYPLDQNVYQAVKGMTAAEATVHDGGIIIMLAKCNDGMGGDTFYHQIADESDSTKTMQLFLNRKREETEVDQWQTQVFLRVLMKASIIFISDMSDEIIRTMHMIPSSSIEDAIEKAKTILQKNNPTITLIPDGVSVIVQ